MQNWWRLVFLLVVMQGLWLGTTWGGGHHHGGSGLAGILAAGLVVQLLANAGGHKHHHGHHHHESRNQPAYHHHGGGVESAPTPHHFDAWKGGMEQVALQQDQSLTSGSWMARPLQMSYAPSRFEQPYVETYNVPYYYPPPSVQWGMS